MTLEQKEQEELEQEFIKLTNYLFDWEECVGLIDSEGNWILKEDIDGCLEEAIRMINEEDYTPVPF